MPKVSPETKLRNDFGDIYPLYNDFPENLELKYKMARVEIDDKYLFPFKQQR